MQVKVAETDVDIERCFPIMAQLRPHLTPSTFIERVKRQQEQDDYHLVYLEDDGAIKAVAGFRIHEMLSRGRFLYVDDLVTGTSERSRGYGSILFDWLITYARATIVTKLISTQPWNERVLINFTFESGCRSAGFTLESS